MNNNSTIEKNNIGKIKITKILLYLSLMYYIFWVCYAIYCFFFGSSWEFIPSLGNHEIKYGLYALDNVYTEFILTTLIKFPYIPIYQFVYILFAIVHSTQKKNFSSK